MFGYKKVVCQCPITKINFCIKINNVNITEVEYTKFLGVIIDKKLTWQRHVTYISNKIAKSLYVLNRLKHKLPSYALCSLYYSLIYPHLIYCIILWGCAAKSILNELLILQKRAVRILNKCPYLSHSDPLFKKCSILKVYDLYEYSCSLFVYKFKHNFLPFVCNTLLFYNIRPSNDITHSLRLTNEFYIPFARTSIRERCITVRGPKCWINLEEDIRNSISISILKNKLMKCFVEKY
jgi:hypothetical protein